MTIVPQIIDLRFRERYRSLLFIHGLIALAAISDQVWAQGDPPYAISGNPSHVQSEQTVGPPSPTGAMVRSIVIPGWGQWYNGKQLKAGAHFALQVGLLAGVLLERNPTGELTAAGNAMLVGLVGFKLFSVADAYVDAHFSDFDETVVAG